MATGTADQTAVPTEQRLVAAAEKLFAQKGIDAVSLRAIMAEADTNVASVHYHFGSKDALVKAVIAHRGREIARQRGRLLDALETAPDPTARRLAEAVVRPIADADAAWVRFISGIIATGHPAMKTVARGFAHQGRRSTALLARICPAVPPATIRFRLAQAMTLAFHVLGDLDNAQGILALSGAPSTPDQIVEQLLDVITAILAGPPEQGHLHAGSGDRL
ncbi:AcrR family transcriptional regulator [Kibdelosporangium banguiense]|uniref:AcrR family transcriptional regulator n=1 Tax=Kibdelosporangium banguiense TaxID=1365924 RepID=A0ABS4U147_9PSEU|nr:TetR/AcrR family transcriptional regulator [Kibdelosporangium banguiense]MBP2330351.1 AcrR family transcriptional regulator [Kibdelosporangium banguiense]